MKSLTGIWKKAAWRIADFVIPRLDKFFSQTIGFDEPICLDEACDDHGYPSRDCG